MNLLHIHNYLHSIYIVLGIISNLVHACSVTQLCQTLSDPVDCSQASLSMGFFRQKYWNGLSFPPPGDLPNPGN